MRLLIVEDLEIFRDTYLLRVFSNLLPMDKLTLFSAPSIEQAFLPITTQDFDIVLMDYALGKSYSAEGKHFRNGADLVRRRREAQNDKAVAKSYIIGNSATHVGNVEMVKAGANVTFHKLQVEKLARAIASLVNDSKKEKKVSA